MSVKGSAILESVLSRAQKDLWNHFEGAADYKHHGLRGDEREEAIRKFLGDRLPHTYRVATGEIVDFADNHSPQVDAIIYDSARNRALVEEANNVILPAEALLAMISIKSQLTRADLRSCYEAAKRVYDLLPFDKRFLHPKGSAPSIPRECRVFFSVFSYESDLRADDWLAKEWRRTVEVSKEVGCDIELINRVLVLKRGLIMTNRRMGKASSIAGGADVLHEWFLHLVNFMGRENGRRAPVDWNLYSRGPKRWTKLPD